MAKYGEKAQEKVAKALHEEKHGQLESGNSGKKVTSRKQAIAIGLSEARAEGDKVPASKSEAGQSAGSSSARSSTGKASARNSSTKRASTAKMSH